MFRHGGLRRPTSHHPTNPPSLCRLEKLIIFAKYRWYENRTLFSTLALAAALLTGYSNETTKFKIGGQALLMNGGGRWQKFDLNAQH